VFKEGTTKAIIKAGHGVAGVCVLLCVIKPILGNRCVRSRGFIVSEPREMHPRSEIADVPTLPGDMVVWSEIAVFLPPFFSVGRRPQVHELIFESNCKRQTLRFLKGKTNDVEWRQGNGGDEAFDCFVSGVQ